MSIGRDLLRDDSGTASSGYALIFVLIGFAIVIATSGLGTKAMGLYADIAGVLDLG